LGVGEKEGKVEGACDWRLFTDTSIIDRCVGYLVGTEEGHFVGRFQADAGNPGRIVSGNDPPLALALAIPYVTGKVGKYVGHCVGFRRGESGSNNDTGFNFLVSRAEKSAENSISDFVLGVSKNVFVIFDSECFIAGIDLPLSFVNGREAESRLSSHVRALRDSYAKMKGTTKQYDTPDNDFTTPFRFKL